MKAIRSKGDELVIVIYGGAFNPPTKAHLEIYHHVKQHLDCRLFVFLPVSSHYTKRSLASNHHRYQMLSLLTQGLDDVKVSTMEFEDSDYRGTYQSLQRFQEKYPNEEIAFLIGADNLPKLHKWINAKSLLAEFKFIVVNRNQTDIAGTIAKDPFLTDFSRQFIVLPEFNLSISSSEFREQLTPELTTKEVYEYIELHTLYRGQS
jgi:nicotinate-nucleotide adenylyltransferase